MRSQVHDIRQARPTSGPADPEGISAGPGRRLRMTGIEMYPPDIELLSNAEMPVQSQAAAQMLRNPQDESLHLPHIGIGMA